MSYLHSLIKNLAFLIFIYSETTKIKLASRRVLLVYKLTILKIIRLLK